MKAQSINRKMDVGIFATSAILLTLFLFYIDEGYYDFRWMKSVGNWIVFAVYVLLLFGGQLFVSRVLLRKLRGKWKWILSVAGGTVGTLVLIFTLFG